MKKFAIAAVAAASFLGAAPAMAGATLDAHPEAAQSTPAAPQPDEAALAAVNADLDDLLASFDAPPVQRDQAA